MKLLNSVLLIDNYKVDLFIIALASIKMSQPEKYDLFKLNISHRITDEATLFQLGGLLGIKDWEIKGIKYHKDKDGL